jgi:DNA-binding NtrC family response regulator
MTQPDSSLIGVIDDDPVMGGSLTHRLELEGYRVVWWQSGGAAIDGLSTARPDLVICDIRLPDMSGEDVFSIVLPLLPAAPFLFVTGFGQIDQAVRLTKAGAVDYIAKPFALPDLLDRIQRLVGVRREPSEVLGRSAAMRQVEALLRRVSNIDSSLLLTGESGVGKEVAARFTHQVSARSQHPFMAVNCAAIPRDLIESELFGHEKGAFTGAHARHQGYAERARDGILFLDEVGDLPMSAQAKLLRVVQERTFARVGGEAILRSSARIVCATNTDLELAVKEGRFRQDLYYRVNVIPVFIPPLRDRLDDILPLAGLFLRECAESFGSKAHGFTTMAERALLAYAWPGNVRELRNRIERAVALSDGSWISEAALFPPTPRSDGHRETLLTLSEVRQSAERIHIQAALDRVHGRVEEAARSLAVSRSTLFDKMRKLGISSEAR